MTVNWDQLFIMVLQEERSMASVFDVARYILEQKGDLPNPVLQELCRLTLRDGIFIREPLLFREKYEFVISDTYPKGEICIDLYNECPEMTVSAEKIKCGDSSQLTVEEKLIINETLNKCYDAVRIHFQNIISDQEKVNEDISLTDETSALENIDEELPLAENDNYQNENITGENIQEEAGYTDVIYQDETEENTEYVPEEYNEPAIDEMSDTVKFSSLTTGQETHGSESTETDQENDDLLNSSEMTDTVYAQNTVMMNDVADYNSPAEDFDDTEPLNYTYQPKPHKRAAENRQRTAPPQPKRPVKRSAKNSDRSFFITVLTVMIILLIIIAVFILSEKKKNNEKENLTPEFTKAETIPEEPEEEPQAEETEPEEQVTEVPETSETTEPVTEATTVVTTTEPEPVTTVPETEAPPEIIWDHSDGRNVLEEITNIDIDQDGIPDAVEVYSYNSEDIYYQIKYSDGRDITYAFPNHNEDRTFDYIVYDKNTGTIYPAGLKNNFSFFNNSGIKMVKINGPEIFSIESSITFNGIQKNCTLNNRNATAEEVMEYYNNIEILYSYNDNEKYMITSLMSTAAGWDIEFSW